LRQRELVELFVDVASIQSLARVDVRAVGAWVIMNENIFRTDPPDGRFLPNIDAAGLFSLAVGIVAAWSWQYGLVPAMQGPLAVAMGDSDFSWLAGGLVAGS
jgi:hypothetical protein